MAEIWTSVKDYAKKHGITIQAVYQQMNRKQNKAFISQHTKKINGVKHLDEEAVRYLENQRNSSPAVVVVEDSKERIEQLEREKELLLLQVADLQQTIIGKSERIEQLQQVLLETKDQVNNLLIEKSELNNLLIVEQEKSKRKWWQFWK